MKFFVYLSFSAFKWKTGCSGFWKKALQFLSVFSDEKQTNKQKRRSTNKPFMKTWEANLQHWRCVEFPELDDDDDEDEEEDEDGGVLSRKKRKAQNVHQQRFWRSALLQNSIPEHSAHLVLIHPIRPEHLEQVCWDS